MGDDLMSDKKDFKEKRKQYLIKPKFQYEFVLPLLLIMAMGGLVSSFILYISSLNSITAVFRHYHLTFVKTGNAILPYIFLTNALSIIFLGIAAYFIIVRKSHQIAGPLYRFEMVLKDMEKGKLGKEFRLRKKDQLKDLMNALNQFNMTFTKKISEAQKELELIENYSLELKKECEDSSALQEIEEHLKNLKTILEYFHIK